MISNLVNCFLEKFCIQKLNNNKTINNWQFLLFLIAATLNNQNQEVLVNIIKVVTQSLLIELKQVSQKVTYEQITFQLTKKRTK